MNPVQLTTTQFFLRFLKKNGIYSAYMKNMHNKGRNAVANNRFNYPNNPLYHLPFDPNEYIWIQMLKWRNKGTEEEKLFWKNIDNKWTTLWQFYKRDKNCQNGTICPLKEHLHLLY